MAAPGERKERYQLDRLYKRDGNMKTAPGERKEKFQWDLLCYNRPWGEKKGDIREICCLCPGHKDSLNFSIGTGCFPPKVANRMLLVPKIKCGQNPDQALKEFSKVTPRKLCFFNSLLCISRRSCDSIKVNTVKLENYVQLLILDW